MSAHPHPQGPPREVIAPPHVSLWKEVGRQAGPSPLEYGEVRLWLVANGPHALFAYWEFHPEEHPEAVGADGHARFFLRVMRCAGEVVEKTIEIQPADSKCMAPAEHADTHYHAELGFFNEQGVWCFLARSGAARTHRADHAASGSECRIEPPQEDKNPAMGTGSWTAAQETRLDGLLAEDVARSAAGKKSKRSRKPDPKRPGPAGDAAG